jgi:hypothetical protein
MASRRRIHDHSDRVAVRGVVLIDLLPERLAMLRRLGSPGDRDAIVSRDRQWGCQGRVRP